MKRIAIIGGGIAGVSAAYEVAKQQQAGAHVECILFEATHRLGGIVETERRDGFVLECGPDSWVTEKSEARELAVELGLESDVIFSQDERRKTYLADGRSLHAMPDGMRMMVPVQWGAMLNSPQLSWQAKLAYLREPKLAEQLKATALDATNPPRDESVRDFIFRHFGAEIADTVAAPLLAGVFGGDISVLSARAVLPAYVALEREHGSLIEGVRKRARAADFAAPVFSTLRKGIDGLIDRMASHIPSKNVYCGSRMEAIEPTGNGWRIYVDSPDVEERALGSTFDALLIAAPAKATARLLALLNASMAELLPRRSSSAIVVNFGFAPEQAGTMRIPLGFGFLVRQRGETQPTSRKDPQYDLELLAQRALLACTFVDQKFRHRAPEGGRLLRAFFGGPNADDLLQLDDAKLHALTHAALERILGKLPEPAVSLIRRLPDSLPLYLVGHLERMAELESQAAKFPHLRFIGSAYHGVGLPDVIRGARSAARDTISTLAALCSS
ncbi:MAG: protoporphyrinogen oxidase [Acidobacteriaceae bacterium]